MVYYFNPKEITLKFAASAQAKSNYPLAKFCILAILGGAFIAFGGLLTIIVAGGMPNVAIENPGLVKFMAGALFPIGLIMVSMTGADLFTSDCAAFTLSGYKRELRLATIIKYLLLSYVFNFIGAQLVSYLFAHQTGIIQSEPWIGYLHDLANHKTSSDFWTVFIKGVGANWLVCLGMFMGIAGKDIMGRCIGIWIPVMLFVALGFEHSIANMFFIPTAIYTGADISWTTFIQSNLLPATLGNFVGGAGLVGMCYAYLFLKDDKSVQ